MNPLVNSENIGTKGATQYLIDEVGNGDIPRVSGFRMLLRMREVPQQIGKILLPDTTIDSYKNKATYGRLVAMGGECFNRNETKWADLGDWIGIPATEGYRLKINGKDMRVINDDQMLLAYDKEPPFSNKD